jgi:catechol 2,3-dioxygenase-like lactoylglutathione lyase family enzyme
LEIAMPVHAMNHFTVLSDDLDRTTAFYERILGLRIGERPPLGFPGAWMYAGEQAVLHIVAGRPLPASRAGVFRSHGVQRDWPAATAACCAKKV